LKTTRALVLDLDGTLIDSSDGVVDAVNYSLRMMEQPEQPPERIKSYIGFPLSQMYPVFTDASVDQLCHHFQVMAARTMVSLTEALPGADDTLRLLKSNGLKLAVATTKIRVHVDGIIAKLGWDVLFDALVGGDEVTRVKPAPEAFKLALNRLEIDADEAIAVGDTINDVNAAKAVPMTVIAVNSPYGGRDQLLAAQPDHFIESITELPRLLKEQSLTVWRRS